MAKLKKIKIIYINGYSRSGTTLLDNVLGQIPGFTTIGEGWYVWRRGVMDNCYCGCAKRFRKCQFWMAVFKEAFGSVDGDYFKEAFKIFKPLTKYRLQMMLGIHSKDLSIAQKNVEKLYQAIAKISKSSVIIDSSKWASYGKLLSDSSLFDVYQVHIVRDPRAVVYSWKREKKYEPFKDSDFNYPRYSIFRTIFEWLILNTSIEFVKRLSGKRYHFLRYEDFVKVPQKEVKSILKFVGEGKRKIGIKNNRVNLDKNHCIAGSPVRFKRGEVEIKLDDEWQEKMSVSSKFITTVSTLPFMLAYGYLNPKNE